MCKNNGAISEFMLFPYKSQFHKKVYSKHTCDILSGVTSGMKQTLLEAARLYFVAI
jgi:hypothetical protein